MRGGREAGKNPQTSHEAARRKIVKALGASTCREHYGVWVSMNAATSRRLISDSKADLLDAVLCAVQGAWASREPGFGIPPDCETEGWIVDPTLAIAGP